MTLLLPFSCAALPKSCSYYALKILKKSEVIYLKQVEHVKTEKKLLETISHPFVVNLMGAFQDEKNLYLMMVRKRAGQQPSPNLSLWPALRARACETRGGSSGRSTETLRMPLPRRRPLRAWCLYARARTLPSQTRARLHPFLTPLLLLLPPFLLLRLFLRRLLFGHLDASSIDIIVYYYRLLLLQILFDAILLGAARLKVLRNFTTTITTRR